MSMPTVLYVDDEPVNIKLFEINFKKYFNLHTAKSGEEALEIIGSINFDVVISDYKMPRMNGAEFITQAKAVKRETKYYLLSAYSEAEIKNRTEDIDTIDGFIAKPWKRDYIIDFIEKALL